MAVALAAVMVAGVLAGPASVAHPGPGEFDGRHLAVVRPPGAVLEAYLSGEWNTVVANPATLLPEDDLVRDHGVQGVLRARLEAWLWNDANGDRYVGAPSATEIFLHENGLGGSPNNGVCEGAYPCEVSGRADAFAGLAVRADPPAGGWPPGSAVLFPDGPALPLTGSAPAFLRVDPAGCVSGALACVTYDALSYVGVPAPLGGFASDVTLSWMEGARSFTYTTPLAWQDPPTAPVPPPPTPAYPFSATISRPSSSAPVEVVVSDPVHCQVSFPTAQSAEVLCVSPPGTWKCALQILSVTAFAGTVSGAQACATGPTVAATAVAPSTHARAQPGAWDLPWRCGADFPGSAGLVSCQQPDP